MKVAGAQDRRDQLGIRKIGIEVSGLRLPGKPIVEREIGANLPRVLKIKAGTQIATLAVLVIAAGNNQVACEAGRRKQWQIVEVGRGPDRCGEIRKIVCDERGRERRQNGLGGIGRDARPVTEAIEPEVHVHIQVAADLEPVRALLPGNCVLSFVVSRDPALERGDGDAGAED